MDLTIIGIFLQKMWIFLPALTDSIVFVGLSTPLIIVASLLIALMLNKQFKGRTVFRAIYFLPVIIMSGPVLSELLANKAVNIIQPTKFAIYEFFLDHYL